jgi:hypothetical protein
MVSPGSRDAAEFTLAVLIGAVASGLAGRVRPAALESREARHLAQASS